MKHTAYKEHQFFGNTKKKYHSAWYFFFFMPCIVYIWYSFCITPFLVKPELSDALTQHPIRSDQKPQQEALLAQAKLQSFTQEKLIALSDRAGEHDLTLVECSIQDRSQGQYLTKTTLFLKMEGEYADIAEFLDSATSDFLCTIDSLQLSLGQEWYHASATLSCATVV